jgi:hypothetical protein
MQAHIHIDSNFAANMMLNIVKDEINIKIATIQATIHREFLCDISYEKAWLVK